MRKERYFQARIRDSIRKPLEEIQKQEGRLGTLNIFVEEILLKYVREKKKRPSDGR